MSQRPVSFDIVVSERRYSVIKQGLDQPGLFRKRWFDYVFQSGAYTGMRCTLWDGNPTNGAASSRRRFTKTSQSFDLLSQVF